MASVVADFGRRAKKEINLLWRLQTIGYYNLVVQREIPD
jgi:hypothetical protein